MTANRRSDDMKFILPAKTGLEEKFVLLDNSAGRGAPSLLFTEPVEIVSATRPEEVDGALRNLERATARGLHAAGFFSYELGYVLEPKLAALLPENRNVPLLWFGLYEEPRVLRENEVEHWLLTHPRGGPYQFTSVTPAWNDQAYEQRFAAVKQKIRAGDIYQLNLTFKTRFRLEGSVLSFYRHLRRRQRVAYAAIIDTGEVTVLSASPELFIEQEGRVVSTRPMKGTAPRAGTPEADAEARRVLSTDAKQRAENLMIVDLMRNDLGRVARIGSVKVTDLFTVETFSTLHQMTSGVVATLNEEIGPPELIKAIFPPGSVIGAPKIHAMELIRTYETEPRGVYCGAIGHIAPGGRARFNVAIRTPVIFRDGRGEMGIGSGIVDDSEGAKEYAECLLKLKFLTDPAASFELIETLLHESGQGFWLIQGHLARLEASAKYFDFAFERTKVEAVLGREVENRRDERLRVRLLLAEDGKITVTSTPMAPRDPDQIMRYAISDTRICSSDPFQFHKTTRRELYDREWTCHHDTHGADEVIYLNERGELAEGSRTNIFVEKQGRLLTPPLTAGVLPGVLRQELIATGKATEQTLTLEDLENAAAVLLGNSVRGLVRALALAPRRDAG